MIASAIYMGAVGLVCSFLPEEILNFLSLTNHAISQLFLQIIGAMYMGYAMLNWMVKGALIGDIYNRPIGWPTSCILPLWP